jgi:AraC-like DNA-binding protein
MRGIEDPYTINAWSHDGVLLELYRYAPGPAESLPKHSHEEYQFCLSLDFPGEYRYRGASHGVPVGSLSVIHPGEVHSARDPEHRRTVATYRMLYASPALLGEAATEVAGRETSEPFFEAPIILDRELAWSFLRLHLALGTSVPRLEQDSHLLSVLAGFVARYADTRPSSRQAGRERRAVRLAREYLEDNRAENVSLARLAKVANLSPYHLNRVFSREVGLPPHRYQVQVRIERAKALLATGTQIKDIVAETGFADHSHLTRHFRRLVGVPPSRYSPQKRKIVQDEGGSSL